MLRCAAHRLVPCAGRGHGAVHDIALTEAVRQGREIAGERSRPAVQGCTGGAACRWTTMVTAGPTSNCET